ncbi:hypothetical protein GCM10009760_50510 [Kitasatospora kazusensis]|uniref:Secreted protein n=1 Tax=Kitasatospora kazusensis TaxID=407974 RepID=A0ABN3A3D1_9ACTN
MAFGDTALMLNACGCWTSVRTSALQAIMCGAGGAEQTRFAWACVVAVVVAPAGTAAISPADTRAVTDTVAVTALPSPRRSAVEEVNNEQPSHGG